MVDVIFYKGKMEEKVSIIVPVYNMAALLDRCLESLKNQTYKNVEIIVVDDGSKDDSGKIADKFGKKDARFKIIHHDVNKGIACGFLTGIRNATGSYIVFVDSDNYVSERMIETFVEVRNETHGDIIQCDALCYTEENEIQNHIQVEREIVSLSSKEDIINDYLLKIHITNNLAAKMFPKLWIDEAEIPEGRQVVDIIVMLQMIDKCDKYVCINDSLYYAYMAPESVSRSEVTERRLSDLVYANNYYRDFISSKWPLYQDYVSYRTASVSIWAYNNIIGSTKIENKKDLAIRFRGDFVSNYKRAIKTSYYYYLPRMIKLRWGGFYYLPLLYFLALKIR